MADSSKLFRTSFFMSLMFPNVFSLGLKRFQVMAVIRVICRLFETAVQRVMAGSVMRICQ